MLRELLKGRGFNIERYRLKDSIYCVNDFDAQARKKRRLREGFIMLKVQINYGI